ARCGRPSGIASGTSRQPKPGPDSSRRCDAGSRGFRRRSGYPAFQVGFPGHLVRPSRSLTFICVSCSLAIALLPAAGNAAAQAVDTMPQAAEPPALSIAEALARLLQVSDALDAADAAVRNRQDLQDATAWLRLPEVTG